MERSPRSDIYQRTIEEQNQKLEKYQAKLRDVVSAYKELQLEKVALEESLRVLSSAQSSSESDLKSDTLETSENEVGATGEEAESKAVTDGNEDESKEDKIGVILPSSPAPLGTSVSDVKALRHQLSTLTSSLTTVTKQKSRLEATYLSEKKKLKQELEDLEKRSNQERDDLLQRVRTLEADSEQWRSKVRSLQQDREKELADHAVVIKELQKMITDERHKKEHLDNQLEDSRLLLVDKNLAHQTQIELYENTIRDLRSELETAGVQMKTLKEKATEPSSLLVHLQKELIDLKESERRSSLLFQQRAEEAESNARHLMAQNESRVVGLESRVAELSESAGSVERLRQQDQLTIQKLRDRIVQLDSENSALMDMTRSVTSAPVDGITTTSATTGGQTSDLDSSMLVDKILHIKDLLKNSSEKSEKPINICEVLLTGEEMAEVHGKCTQQYEHLRDEFERYKLRAQSILKNKASSKDQSTEREMAALKSQVGELRDRVVTLRLAADEQDAKLRDKEDGFNRALTSIRENHRAEMAELEAVHRARVTELEMDMRRHRDRTVSMLAEKDRDLASLRLQVATADRLVSMKELDTFESYSSLDAGGVGASSVEGNVTGSIVSQLISNVEISDDSKILHFANERSRYETELATLRRQKHSLEAALRDARRDAAFAAEMQSDERRRLVEEVAKRDRDRSRETANLEYLKNVVYRYMLCIGGSSARQQMLNAISTILQFSPAEKHQVQDHISRGWWVNKSD